MPILRGGIGHHIFVTAGSGLCHRIPHRHSRLNQQLAGGDHLFGVECLP